MSRIPADQRRLFAFRRAKRRIVRAKGKSADSVPRSLAYLEAEGWRAARAEQYKPHLERDEKTGLLVSKGGHTVDLFGFMDILAFRPDDPRVLAVQTTSYGMLGVHLTAYRSDPELSKLIREWLAAPHRALDLHGWQAVLVPNRSRAGSHVRWMLTIRHVEAKDLIEEPF